MKSALLFLVFNRPDPTRQVFEVIRAARPSRLYVAADGPRNGYQGEAAQCAEVRHIVTAVDWPCETKTLFRDENIGCKRAPSQAISWFFECEEEGVILEDDCLPAPGFFSYCDELLDYYRDDHRIWQVCGTNMFGKDAPVKDDVSYRFSKYGPIWGWATWRRAWKHYDPDLKDWPAMSRPEVMQSVYATAAERKARLALGNKLFSGEMNSCWDFQWGMTKNFNHGLSVVPIGNLIRNIGFGPDATHTTGPSDIAPTDLHGLSFPLRHPKFVLPDANRDAEYLSRFFLPTQRRTGRQLASQFVRFVLQT